MIDYEKIISPVVSALPPSGIRKFFDIVAEMDDAISLGVGEPDFTTPWAIREAGIYSLEKGQYKCVVYHTNKSPADEVFLTCIVCAFCSCFNILNVQPPIYL